MAVFVPARADDGGSMTSFHSSACNRSVMLSAVNAQQAQPPLNRSVFVLFRLPASESNLCSTTVTFHGYFWLCSQPIKTRDNFPLFLPVWSQKINTYKRSPPIITREGWGRVDFQWTWYKATPRCAIITDLPQWGVNWGAGYKFPSHVQKDITEHFCLMSLLAMLTHNLVH